MQGTEALGSTSATLNYVFDGDSQAWTWLNTHMGSSDRVATLDNRIYYYRNPDMLFYLDGREAAPLLHLRSPESLVAFFEARHVQYVYSPAWSVAPTPTRHPVINKLLLFALLGSRDFPLVSLFAAGGYNLPDEVYRVGPLPGTTPPRPAASAVFSGVGTLVPVPPLVSKTSRCRQTTTPRGCTPKPLPAKAMPSSGSCGA